MNNSTATLRYSVDAWDCIVAVNGEWDRFARANDAPPELYSEMIMERKIWDFISSEPLLHVYRRILDRVRAGNSFEFDFRCDSAALRRYLVLRVRPLGGGGAEFETRTVRTEERVFQPLLTKDSPKREGIVVACSWCNKFKTGDDAWLEAEEAVTVLNLFDDGPVPKLSHGMCAKCYDAVVSAAEARAA